MHAAHICTLLDAPAGTRVRVHGVAGQRGIRSRLCALGITPGTEVEVCDECSCHGSRRVKVRDAALVLCASVAQSVLCECPRQEGEALRAPLEPCRGVCAEGEDIRTICCDEGCEKNEHPVRRTCKGLGAPHGHHDHHSSHHHGHHGGAFRHRGR